MKRLINIQEASEYLGIKKNTLYSWVSERRIPNVKLGGRVMFEIAELDKFIEKNKRPISKFYTNGL